jgi:hypothetical protein
MAQCSGELEIGCPVHAEVLVVLARPEPQVDLLPAQEELEWEEVAALDLLAVGGERIDLAIGVHAPE